MKTKRMKKVMGITLAVAMLLAAGVTAFAAEAETETNATPTERRMIREHPGGKRPMDRRIHGVRPGMGAKLLDQLVEEGVVPGEEAQSLRDFAALQRELDPEDRARPEEGQTRLEFLVSEDVISQETADALKTRFETMKEERRQDLLDRLEEEAGLSAEKAEAVLDFMEASRREREEMRKDLAGMDWKERLAYVRENRDDFTGPLEQMVEDGLLTKEEAEAVRDLLPDRPEGFREPARNRGVKNGKPFGGRLDAEKSDSLPEAGVL